MEFEHILVDRSGDFATVTMNRPQRRNALSLDHMRELIRAFTEIGDSDALGIVLAGNGPVFSSGHDFADVAEAGLSQVRALLVTCTELMTLIQQGTDLGQVGVDDVGEVVPGAEHRAVAGQHDAQRVAVTQVAERPDQLAHVVLRQRVAPLRPVHRDGGEIAGPLHQDVLEPHRDSFSPPPQPTLARARRPAPRRLPGRVRACTARPRVAILL